MRRRVISTLLDFWVEPAVAFPALCGSERPAFWLDSGVDAGTGMSCMGTSSQIVTAAMFDFLRNEQNERSYFSGVDAPFPLGWVGWLGYELRQTTLGIQVARKSRYPDAAFQLADRAVVFNHETRVVTLVDLGVTKRVAFLPCWWANWMFPPLRSRSPRRLRKRSGRTRTTNIWT